MRFRIIHLFAFTTIIALVLLVLASAQDTVWDGHAPLKVTLVQPQDRKIVAVASTPLSNHKEADAFLLQPDDPGFTFDSEEWNSAQAFTTRIPLSGRVSFFGVEMNYFQFPFIALRLQLDDGSVQYQIVEVPDLRKQRSITVAVEPSDSNQ